MEGFTEYIIDHFNFWIYVILMMLGMYAMITKKNLIKKLIGMSIFQTAIILFFVSLGVKKDSDIPIIDHRPWAHHLETGDRSLHGFDHHDKEPAHHGDKDAHGDEEKHGDEDHGGDKAHHAIDADGYANPLPHVLMLTAIVVGVSTLGVALALTQAIYHHYGTLEEPEILARIRSHDHG